MASDQLPPIKPQPSCNGLEDTRSGAGTQLHLEVAFKADRDAALLVAIGHLETFFFRSGHNLSIF